MEGCAAYSSHMKIHTLSSCIATRSFLPQRQLLRSKRTNISRNAQLSSWNCIMIRPFLFANPKASPHHRLKSIRFHCIGTIISSDIASTFEWIPVVDQVLLMASVFLTYMAGVIPAKKSSLSPHNQILIDDTKFSGDSTVPGRSAINHAEVHLKSPWDIVEEKLMDVLSAIEKGDKWMRSFVNLEQKNKERPLSLYAIAEGPRVRLLWASFRWLKQQVDAISGSAVNVNTNDWSTVVCQIFRKSCKPVFMAWLEKECCLKSEKFNKVLPAAMLDKLMGDDSISRNMRNSGKEDLYAELTHFLIFGSLRESCFYDSRLFVSHGVAILEDLMITLADGIASVYLELISVDSNMSIEMNSFDLTLCTLSTRELQKLRNEVALDQWLHQNMKAIVSMYEDRFDLYTLQSHLIEDKKEENGERSWWEKLTLGKSTTISPLRAFAIDYLSVTVKRTKELRALTGWRYYYSLFLEFADIITPLIRTLFAKIRDAISFLLVCLIGRSLGLIYTGIRQSLKWK